MFFNKNIKKIIFNDFTNCTVRLEDSDFSMKNKNIFNQEFSFRKKGDVLNIYQNKKNDNYVSRNYQNYEFPIKNIEIVQFNNCSSKIVNENVANYSPIEYFIENSKLIFDNLFQEKVVATMINSVVYMTRGSYFQSADIEIKKNSKLYLDKSYIHELDLKIGDINGDITKSDFSFVKMHKRAFIDQINLEMSRNSSAELNILKISNVVAKNIERLILSGNSVITIYDERDNHKEALRVNNEKNLISDKDSSDADREGLIKNIYCDKLDLLGDYTPSSLAKMKYSFMVSIALEELKYPESIMESLKKEKDYKEEEKQKLKKQISLMIEKGKQIESNRVEMEALAMEARAIYKTKIEQDSLNVKKSEKEREFELEILKAKAEADRAAKYCNYKRNAEEERLLNKSNIPLYFEKLAQTLNLDYPTNKIDSENKTYFITALTRSFEDNIELNEKQRNNRIKLCILFDIKYKKEEVLF